MSLSHDDSFKKSPPAKSSSSVPIEDLGMAVDWDQARRIRSEQPPKLGTDVVIYRRTNGPPSQGNPNNWRLWRQQDLNGNGEESGWTDGTNEKLGYNLLRVPSTHDYLPESGTGKLADAVKNYLQLRNAGPPSDVGPR